MKSICLALAATAIISISCTQRPLAPQWIPKRVVGLDYPLLARMAQVRGQVEVICTINPDGLVASATVKGNPHPILAKAAKENASRWTFMNSSDAGRSQRTATLIYAFKMEGDRSHHPVRQFAFEYPCSVTITSEYCQLEDSCY